MGRPMLDLTGKRFTRLVAIKIMGFDKWGFPMWLCQCRCGKLTLIARCNLRSGSTRSCGCLASEIRSKVYRSIGHENRKHGEADRNHQTTEYQAWSSMKRRCYNPNGKKYHLYGGRGITVCRRWRSAFENFLLDVGRRPGKSYVLDRINNDGNYEPKNIRWATLSQSNKNRRPFKRVGRVSLATCR